MSAQGGSPPPEPSAAAPLPKAHSCALCAQRKVKCDKKNPCYNCIKARVVCVPSVPNKPRRRRRKLSTEELLTRLGKCEELLKRHGIKLDDNEAAGSIVMKSSGAAGPGLKEAGLLHGALQEDQTVSKLRFSSHMWSSLSDEILEVSSDDELDVVGKTTPEASPGFSFILLQNGSASKDLTSIHPQPFQIFRLWQAFLDNVNPLVKLFHAPSIQQQISQAIGSLDSVSKPLEALMFSIYSSAIASLSNDECLEIMGEEKTTLFVRFTSASQQSLANASYLESSSMTVLQAFLLYLLAIREGVNPKALYILTGAAVRIAKRAGFHAEDCLSKLSVFEAEIARRMWWQIIIFDGHTASRAASDSTEIQLWDTKAPLNINDSDLNPNMREKPTEHAAATEMVFCLIRAEFGRLFRTTASTAKTYHGSWAKLCDPGAAMEEKERIINELENDLEEKYLKYCDPDIPFHLLALAVGTVMVSRVKLFCRHPRRRPDRGLIMSQTEKDDLFDICLKMIATDNRCHGNPGIQKYLWHVNLNFQVDAFVYLLSELRHYVVGKRADDAWLEISRAFYHHPDLLADHRKPLNVAIGNLALKSWKDRELNYAQMGQVPPEGQLPRFISVLRSQRSSMTETDFSNTWHEIQEAPVINQPEDFSSFSTEPIPIDMDMTPIDWAYWNQLLQQADDMMPAVSGESYDEQFFNFRPNLGNS